jgi:hypothetical protein
MSAALITLFAVSALGALGMAVYGFRVLISRWEQPRTPRLPRVEPPPPSGPALAAPPPSRHVVPVVGWGAAVAPRSAPPPPPQFGVMATPFPGPAPMQAPQPPPPSSSLQAWAPPPPVAAFLPRSTRPPAPPVHEVPRFARGSIPPEVSPELLDAEHDDEDAVEFADEDPTPLSSPEPRSQQIIQRGARFSVIRSTRR